MAHVVFALVFRAISPESDSLVNELRDSPNVIQQGKQIRCQLCVVAGSLCSRSEP